MVASGLGVSVLPRDALTPKYHSRLVVPVPFTRPAPSRRIALAYRRSFPRPGHRAMRGRRRVPQQRADAARSPEVVRDERRVARPEDDGWEHDDLGARKVRSAAAACSQVSTVRTGPAATRPIRDGTRLNSLESARPDLKGKAAHHRGIDRHRRGGGARVRASGQQGRDSLQREPGASRGGRRGVRARWAPGRPWSAATSRRARTSGASRPRRSPHSAASTC